MKNRNYAKETAIFYKFGGVIRCKEALEHGIHPRKLYSMRDQGIIETVSRGIYRLTDILPDQNHDLTLVAMKAPAAVICLISALNFHGMTTQIPHMVYTALERHSSKFTMSYPPLRIFYFSEKAFSEGIEVHVLNKRKVRIYSLEKTLADCFKFRNKIGLDVAIESLKMYFHSRNYSSEKLLYYAKVCRVEKVMRPYLESLV